MIRGLQPGKGMEDRGTIAGPPPLVITLLVWFAPFMILSDKLELKAGHGYDLQRNRMSKKEITFNMKIPKHPHLCSFQRRTS